MSTLASAVSGCALTQLGGIAVLGGVLYVADTSAGSILAIDPGTGAQSVAVDTFSGNDPAGVCTDGRSLFVCLSAGNRVMQVDVDAGVVSLLAGQSSVGELDGLGAQARFSQPTGCVFDATAHAVYVTDKAGDTIRAIQ